MIIPMLMSLKNIKQNNINIVFDGDSLTAGEGSGVDQYYPKKVRDLISTNRNITFHSFGVNGQSITSMINDANTQIVSLIDNTKYNIIIAWEDVNQILNIGSTAQQSYDLFSTYFSLCSGFDLKILVNSPYPRTMGGDFHGTTYDWSDEVRLQQKNFFELIKTKNGWNDVVDLRLNSKIGGRELQEYNPIYFADWAHQTQLGYNESAYEVKKILMKYI
jgi:hypothetical protein